MTDDSPHSVGIKPKGCVFGGDSMCTYKYVCVLYTHMCVFLCVFAPRSFCLITSAPHRCTTPPRWKVPALHAFTFFLFHNAFVSKPQTRPTSCDPKHQICESSFKNTPINQYHHWTEQYRSCSCRIAVQVNISSWCLCGCYFGTHHPLKHCCRPSVTGFIFALCYEGWRGLIWRHFSGRCI